MKEHTLDDNICVKQARAMDSWLELMETESVSNKRIAPNIETYEAVIQGWLRTGTREGLDRAQALLQKLIVTSESDPSLKPRLQTFHPVLASLYHSNSEESAQTIIDWITEWENLSSASDEALDARLISMKLWAMLHKQNHLFHDRKNKESPLSNEVLIAEMKSIAAHCSEIVLDASAAVEQWAMQDIFDDQPLDPAYFTQAAKAWARVATMGLEQKDSKLTYEALSEMMHLLVGFENLIHAVKPPRGISFRSTLPLNAQFEHLVSHAHQFFYQIIIQLTEHHDVNDRQEVLLLIEKMTRVLGEFEEVQFQNAQKQENGKTDVSKRLVNLEQSVLPDDHFNYQLKKDNVVTFTRHAFLWKVVTFLDQASKDKNNINDVARLCHLVKEIGTSRQNASRLVETMDKFLYRLTVLSTGDKRRESSLFKVNREPGSRIVKGKDIRKPTSRLEAPFRRRKTNTNVAKKINGAM